MSRFSLPDVVIYFLRDEKKDEVYVRVAVNLKPDTAVKRLGGEYQVFAIELASPLTP